MPLSDSGERIKFELQSFAAHNFNAFFDGYLSCKEERLVQMIPVMLYSKDDTC